MNYICSLLLPKWFLRSFYSYISISSFEVTFTIGLFTYLLFPYQYSAIEYWTHQSEIKSSCSYFLFTVVKYCIVLLCVKCFNNCSTLLKKDHCSD